MSRRKAMFFKSILTPTGVEIFPQDNAASAADLNALGAWNSLSGGTYSVSSTEFYDGAYSLKQITTSAYSALRVDIPVLSGKTYNLSVWAKRGIQGTVQDLRITAGPFTVIGSFGLPTSSWAEYTWTGTATANGTLVFRCYGGYNGTAGDEIYIDLVSIIET